MTGLHSVYAQIAEALDMETAKEIHRMFHGQQVTFPVRLYSAKYLKAVIQEEYVGTNLRAMARKYGHAEKTIRRMLKNK